ncbi:MAG: QueT transporter family protein [Clostridia bacterium]|nr:QueT transporter family protein [Clostridia bacterium]
MKRNTQKRVRYITLSATIAALYVVLTLISAAFGLSSGAIQLRISEALCVLVAFTPAAIPGLTIGCLISNLVASANILDIVFGTLATFLGALGGYYLRKRKWLITMPTLLSNVIIVPLVIVYGFGVKDMALPLVALTVGIGEFLSATVLGTGLLLILQKYNFKIK